MRRITVKTRLAYAFDRLLSRGTPALVGMLFVASTVTILLVALAVWISGTAPDGRSFPRILWDSLLRTLDPGTMGGDEGPAFFLAMMLTVTLAGIFLVSMLIGIVTTWLDTQLERLRRGRSPVLETGHIAILGWNAQLVDLVKHLEAFFRTNRRRGSVAVLAPRDKVAMEEELRSHVHFDRHIDVICRTGNAVDPSDLEILNVSQASAVVVLAPDGSRDPDTVLIRVALALAKATNRSSRSPRIVAATSSPETAELLPQLANPLSCQTLDARSVIARVAAQIALSPGLMSVYSDLLGFEGHEFYVTEVPQLAGKSFGESLLAFEEACPVGIVRGDHHGARLLPPFDEPLDDDTRLVLLAPDLGALSPRVSGVSPAETKAKAAEVSSASTREPLKILAIGWNTYAPLFIRQLDHYVPPGSELFVCPNTASASPDFRALDLENLHVELRECDTSTSDGLRALGLNSYDHVMVLSRYDVPAEEADAESLLLLYNLRRLKEELGGKFTIVAELHDSRNRELADVARPDDIILSDHIVSSLMAQIVLQPEMHSVFSDLFDPEGAEIYLKPAAYYFGEGRQISFADLVAEAAARREIALGYFHEGHLHLNPPKSRRLAIRPSDRIVVLAESA